MSAFEARILSNLRERVHGVNAVAAISGVNDLQAGLRVLNSLVCDESVVVETVHGTKLYKLNPNLRSLNAHGNLTIVK